MTSLDRLHQAMTPGENGRPPVLPPRMLKASLGKHGLSAAEQLLSTSERPGLDAIPNPEIKALFEKDYAIYKHIFEGGGMTMPTPEELAAGGIDWARLAELKEAHSDHDLVVAPLMLPLEQLRDVVSGVANDESISDNPLQKYSQTKEKSDGLWVSGVVVDNWDTIMAATVKEWQLPVAEITHGYSPLQWAAFLIPSSDKPEHPDISFQDMRQQNLGTTTIPGYIAYQMKCIQQGQVPIDGDTYTWALGEFTNSDGGACAPYVNWFPSSGQVDVDWYRVSVWGGNLGVRSPLG